MFSGEDVSHVSMAKKLLDSVWDKMELDFEPDKKVKEVNSR